MPRSAAADTGTQPGRVEATEETRRRLVEAAIDVFARRGFDRANVSEIARAAGFTTGAIYANFQGKTQLLAEAVAAYAPAELEALFEPLLGRTLTPGVAVKLIEILMTGPSVRQAESLVLDGLAVAARDREVAAVLRRGVRERATAIENLVDAAGAEEMLPPDVTADTLRYFVLALVFGAMAMKALDYQPPPAADVAAFAERLVAAFVREDAAED